MGMFDNVKIEYEMPDPEVQDSTFQTKDLENLLDNYTITHEGRLILHKHHYESVPDEERPYYGKPQWEENEFFRMIGCMKSIYDEDVDMDFHGILEVHEYTGNIYYSYNLKFTDGTLVDIKRNQYNESSI